MGARAQVTGGDAEASLGGAQVHTGDRQQIDAALGVGEPGADIGGGLDVDNAGAGPVRTEDREAVALSAITSACTPARLEVTLPINSLISPSHSSCPTSEIMVSLGWKSSEKVSSSALMTKRSKRICLYRPDRPKLKSNDLSRADRGTITSPVGSSPYPHYRKPGWEPDPGVASLPSPRACSKRLLQACVWSSLP